MGIQKLILFLLILLLSFSSLAQPNLVNGKVIDQENETPLAFVHIIINNTRSGTVTDIDGRFKILTKSKIETISFSYVGYKKLQINLDDYLNTHPDESYDDLLIRLEKTSLLLNEVVFKAGENPAIPIIKKVIDNRKSNNPENIKSFKYKSYNKFFVDGDIKEEGDEDLVKFLETKYFFLMESVTERKYLKPGRSKETVIANRVSGFQNPLFTTLANSFQPFTFYEDYIKILNKRYLNPLTKGTFNKYYFNLEDSIISDRGKVYIISFEPLKRNFDGLKGLLYINTYKYAVQNVIAETANMIGHLTENHIEARKDGNDHVVGRKITTELNREIEDNKEEINEELNFSVKIQQKYILIEDEFWFPKQLNTDITLSVTESNDGNNQLLGTGRSYLSDIVLLPEIKSRKFNRLALEFDPEANTRDSLFWEKNRTVPLSGRGIETYNYIDSVGKEIKLDRIVNTFAAITTGKIPWKSVDFDIKRFLDFNRFEYVRLGLGFHTNKRFSQSIEVGGYLGYGIGDNDFKYGGDINLKLTDKNDFTLSVIYYKDLLEFGGTDFYLDTNPLESERNRGFLIENFDKTENREAALSFYFLKYLDIRASVSEKSKEVTTDYKFVPDLSDPNSVFTSFEFTEMKIGLKYSFREKLIEVFGNKISLGTAFPIIWVNYTKGFNNFGQGDHKYDKIDFKISKLFTIRGLGQPAFTIKGGYVSGKIPATNLYNGNGSKVLSVPIEAANSFQTMRMNEFLSDKYISLFTDYNLGKVIIDKRKSEPHFSLITNIGFGKLENPDYHQGIDFQIMNKGYFESGFTIKNIYKWKILGFGFGTYYRYGYYSRKNTIDNFAFKLTTELTL